MNHGISFIILSNEIIIIKIVISLERTLNRLGNKVLSNSLISEWMFVLIFDELILVKLKTKSKQTHKHLCAALKYLPAAFHCSLNRLPRAPSVAKCLLAIK